ncbi:MAG: Ig-like domain-containing protein [Patescibacteria group bacterium]|jgi:hypothetical protein
MKKIQKLLVFSIIIFSLFCWPIKSIFAAELTSLTLSPAELTIEAGKTATFKVLAAYSDGTSADVTEEALFKLDGGGFTGIPGKKGEFTANAQGKWSLSVNFGTKSASAAITISHGAATSLNVLPTQANLTADGILPIRVFAVDALGNGWDVLKDATFSTTDPLGTVNADGYIPHTAGAWAITATYQGLAGSFPITITPGMLTSLSIEPASTINVDPGDEISLVAKGTDAKGNQVTANVNWKTSNVKVAKIDAMGKLTAEKAGQTNVIAEAEGIQAAVPIAINSNEATEVTNEIVAVEKPNAVLKNPRVAAEEVEKVPVTQNENISTEKTENQGCKNIAHPWSIIILLLQIIILAAYFTWQIKKPIKLWWVGPIVLTAILLIIYSQLFCNNTYLWWPWAVLGISVIFISVYYQRLGMHDVIPPPETKV